MFSSEFFKIFESNFSVEHQQLPTSGVCKNTFKKHKTNITSAFQPCIPAFIYLRAWYDIC